MRQVELEGNNSEGVVESSVTPTPQRSTQAHHASAKSTDPPPKKVTSSMPIYTPKAASDFKTTKSAGSLLNNSGKPKQ
ncbi:hypothetical protein GO730_28420 [Spirosoma sp. HMF3257]|uniref:Uncharacterized protein n=1 Tax=Spirosoma telluris TaxID=2183553 RepID=A0A327NT52_9BACT|nr:hypothetical protein [Spirosoma telluris]RAI77126.1 hypothetical protein HMF3257_28360 [Spirosoma telluris]